MKALPPSAQEMTAKAAAEAAAQREPVPGVIFPPRTLILRTHCGDASDTDGNKFELSTHPSGAPLVRCLNTGKYYGLKWEHILDLARRAGIAEPHTEPTPELEYKPLQAITPHETAS